MLAPHRGAKANKPQPRPSLEAPEATDDSGSSPIVVLPSSTELFYFYGQSLEQCAKLSTGKPLYDLCNVHKKWLRIYAGGPRFRTENIVSLIDCFFDRGCPYCQYEAVMLIFLMGSICY
jgi:hypothetical protein